MPKDKDLEDIKNGKGLKNASVVRTNGENTTRLPKKQKIHSEKIYEGIERSIITEYQRGDGTTTVLRAAPENKKISDSSAEIISKELIKKWENLPKNFAHAVQKSVLI